MFIYHMVPKEMHGHILHPLFVLKETSPEIYSQQLAKYDDHPERKKIPMTEVIKLNCRRGDVLNFSSLHPRKIFDGYKSVFDHVDFDLKFYQIPIAAIGDLPAVYLDVADDEYQFGVGSEKQDRFYTIISPETYRELDYHPKRNILFYEKWKNEGKRGAPLYPHIPHVMVKGSVDISGCKILDWKSPL